MIRSMYSGISGLKNFQTKLDVIGNNIANVNTYGFKKGRTTFKDIVSQQLAGSATPTPNRGGVNPIQVGLGGTISTIDTIHTQGSPQTTGRALDLAISGDGFFVVNDGVQSFYTRAGNFYLDRDGTLVNANGLKIQGYQVDANGQVDYNNIGELRIPAGDVIPPQQTTDITFKGNLNSEAEVGDNVQVSYKVIDSLGTIHDINLTYTKTATNAWSYVFSSPTVTVTGGGTVTFNSTDGSLNTHTTTTAFTVNPTAINGVAPFQPNIDFAKITQIAGSNSVDVDQITGNSEGVLESFNISQSGEINGVYSNGEVRVLGQIALATFNNTGGLTKSGDNLFQVSNNSGLPKLGVPGDGRGMIAASSLEMSNVDLSEEFTEMIVAQRGFQANTRIITTSDEILQELVNLKR